MLAVGHKLVLLITRNVRLCQCALCKFSLSVVLIGGCCADINECERVGACSQICENLNGTYRCGCHDGYVLEADTKLCRAAGFCFYILSLLCCQCFHNVVVFMPLTLLGSAEGFVDMLTLASYGQHFEINCLQDSREDYYLHQGGYVFAGFCLSVCLSVWHKDNSKSYGRIFLKF